MLAADKLQLQSALKQQATALKEKEFQLHHTNLMTVGTQAAVLAGLDITMFIEFHPEPLSEWNPKFYILGHVLFITYYTMIVMAFCSNIIVVSQTTILSVLGAGLALRGPDNTSMIVATDALYEERKFVFTIFGVGLTCTIGSVLNGVWLMLPLEAATMCFFVTLLTCYIIYTNYQRISMKLDYDESQTVDFYEFMTIVPSMHNNNHNNHNSNKNKKMSPRNHQHKISNHNKKHTPNNSYWSSTKKKRTSSSSSLSSLKQKQQPPPPQQQDYYDTNSYDENDYDYDDCNNNNDDYDIERQRMSLLSSQQPRQRHQLQYQQSDGTIEEYTDESEETANGDNNQIELITNQYNNHNNNNRLRKNKQQQQQHGGSGNNNSTTSHKPKLFSIQTV